LRDHHDELSALGADVMAVATSAHFQAESMQADLPFPLLLDPDFTFRQAIDLRSRFRLWDLVRSESSRNYVQALRRGQRMGIVTPKHALNKPAVLIRRPDGVVAWAHEGASLGDYPPIDTVIRELRRVIAGPDF